MVFTSEVMNSAASISARRDGTLIAGGNESVILTAKRDLEHAPMHGAEEGVVFCQRCRRGSREVRNVEGWTMMDWIRSPRRCKEDKMFLMSGVAGFCVVMKRSSTLHLNLRCKSTRGSVRSNRDTRNNNLRSPCSLVN